MATMTKKKSYGLMTNPAIRRAISNAGEAGFTEERASYAGIIARTSFFLVLTIIGIFAYVIIHAISMRNGSAVIVNQMDVKGIMSITLTATDMIGLAVAAVLTIVFALVSIFAHSIVQVTGSIYCLAEGYLLSFITSSLAEGYRWIGVLALVMTIALVGVMLLLYSRQVIRVTARFRMVSTVTFLTVIIGGIVIFIMSLIPPLSGLVAGLAAVMANPVVSIIFSVVFIIIACMFLVSDFESIHTAVEAGMPKQSEWILAYGVAYTVLYLYIKILDLLLTIAGNNKK